MSTQTIHRPTLREEFRLELRDRALDGTTLRAAKDRPVRAAVLEAHRGDTLCRC